MPLFTIVTPSHEFKYLSETYKSIKNQSLDDWEWVLCVNGEGVTAKQDANGVLIPDEIHTDDRVRVIELSKGLSGIGAIKNSAFSYAKGDFLIELDHDDLLPPYALEVIKNELGVYARENQDELPDFIYSDFVEFKESSMTYHLYSENSGWQYGFLGSEDWCKEYGLPKEVTYLRAFKPNPASMSSIHFAPNHVRIWKRDFYHSVQGHDGNLSVCDDFDLVVRTYLESSHILHIEHPLYWYRFRSDESNSYKLNFQEVQKLSRSIGENNILEIAKKWSTDEGLKLIELGAAFNRAEGFDGVDVNCEPEQQGMYRLDVTKSPLPFETGSVGVIMANDFLEHIRNCGSSTCKHGYDEPEGLCVVGLMNEIHRVLAHGGVFIANTPSAMGKGAYQDPTHISFWVDNSFWYYTNPNYAKYIRNEDSETRFNIFVNYEHYPTKFHEKQNIPYVRTVLFAEKKNKEPLAGLSNWR